MTTTYDVLVIGAGLAGSVAARRAQQLGAKVYVVDKASAEEANATRRSGGAFHAATFDPRIHEPDELANELTKATMGHARPKLVRAWADNVLRSLLFLEAEGATFERTGLDEAHWNRTGPAPRVTEHLLEEEPDWKGAANDRLLNKLRESIVAHGGEYRLRARAVGLEVQDGTVVGAWIESPGEPRVLIRAKATIMADGGFVGSPELIHKYVTPHTYISRCGNLSTGDCLEMAMAIGAQAIELETAYQMVAVRDRATHATMAHPPSPTWLINAAIVVDADGRRLGDETMQTPDTSQGEAKYPSIQYADKRLSGRMSRSKVAGDAWIVFDEDIWQTTGRRTKDDPTTLASSLSMNPTILEHGGTIFSAGSIHELAELAGISPSNLNTTVDDYNAFCLGGQAIDPVRTERGKPIAKAPFHAIPVVPGLFFTMGGILVNERGQALDLQNRPIPGLYAAGGTMGGLMGGPNDGYAGGWSQAAVFGLLSAEHAAGQWSDDEVASAAAG